MAENIIDNILFGKDQRRGALFTNLGKTLTAVSLGLQGKDPSSVFDDINTDNINSIKTRAELAELIEPGAGKRIIASAIGMGSKDVISPKTADIQQPESSVSSSAQLSVSPKVDRGIVSTGGTVTQKTLGGSLSESYKDIGGEQALADIEVNKQVTAQAEKAAEETRRDFNRAMSAFDTNLDAAINFGVEQEKLFGTKPGAFFGIIDKLTPDTMNPFKNALEGSAIEGAALVATQIIPSTRAAKVTEIFKGSVGKVGNTMEATINNNVTSMQNAFANALSQDIELQKETIDKATGKPISELKGSQQAAAIARTKKEFANKFEALYISKVLQKAPQFLPKDITDRLPKFKSVEDAEKENLIPGTMIYIDGRKAVIE